MIRHFDTAEAAVEEATYRANRERCAQAICGDDAGYSVQPLQAVTNHSDTIEIIRRGAKA